MIEIIKIGFISITLIDLFDISLVSFIIYQVYKMIKGTVASQIFSGLIFIITLSFVAQVSGMRTMTWILRLVTDIWVFAFIVLFQPEIRRFLVALSKTSLLQIFSSQKNKNEVNLADEITQSVFEMAQVQHGALIVFEKDVEVKAIIETGQSIQAIVSKDLLKNIFFPRSPLHDGAVVIGGDQIKAARCTLPLSNISIVDGVQLGMRHKAALGVTEQADVLVLVVSEETGSISVAENGNLTRGLSKDKLRKLLTEKLNLTKSSKIKQLFEEIRK